MSLILVFNKNSPRAHTKSELGVLGVHGKLVKYVVHSSKKKIEFFFFSFTQAAQTAIDQFLVPRNFRGCRLCISLERKVCLLSRGEFGFLGISWTSFPLPDKLLAPKLPKSVAT
jgi:hypothetical protein